MAEKTGIPFYDTDALIIKRIGKTIQEWVEKMGWESFRQEEKGVIQEISSLAPAVIALGGGTVLEPENREILKQKGLVLWLTADVPTIMERMNADPNNKDMRPHLSEKDWESEIRATLTERSPIYERLANFIVDTRGKGLEEVAEEICNFIQLQEGNQ